MTKYLSTIVVSICFFTLSIVLYSRGQPLWCKLSDFLPWTVDVISPHNSQHFFDPYSFSHVLHGFLLVWIFGAIRLSRKYFLALGVILETFWEILENSNFIIDRYRIATISLNYYGDSIANSLADVVSCMLGLFIAMRLGFIKTFCLFLIVEISMISTMRDSLIVNIIMLIHPFNAIKAWQGS